jgi:integrase/recombinase XerD
LESIDVSKSSRRGGPRSRHALSRDYLSWLQVRGQSPATLKLAAMALGLLPHGDVRRVRPRDLSNLASKILRRYAPESARVLIWRIKHFFGWVAGRGRLLENPAANLQVPRRRNRLIGPLLKPDEIARLLAALDVSKSADLRDRALYEVLYGSGLRVGEVRRLQIGEVDLERREIRVVGGKGGKDRVVPMTEAAAEWLEKLLSARAHAAERVFVSTQGSGALSEAVIQQRLRKLARRARIATRVTPHALRRTCATDLLAAGASPMIVKELLGHADVRTLGRYIAARPVELKRTHQIAHPRP